MKTKIQPGVTETRLEGLKKMRNLISHKGAKIRSSVRPGKSLMRVRSIKPKTRLDQVQ